jgi:hypothetical protein
MPTILICASLASLNLSFGIYDVLQPEFTPAVVALDFALALFYTLLTLAVIRKS